MDEPKLRMNDCLQCGQPAKFWSGHVHKEAEKRKLIVGWCQTCHDATYANDGSDDGKLPFSSRTGAWMALKVKGLSDCAGCFGDLPGREKVSCDGYQT